MTFRELQDDVAQWSRHNFDDKPLLGVTESVAVFHCVGELAHAVLKREQGIRGSAAQREAAERDAVGDIVIYLADFCHRRGYDLDAIIQETWGQVRQRDWKKNPQTGRA